MSLLKVPTVVLDCQTTGMQPSTGRILEIAWAVVQPEIHMPNIESWILKGDEVPAKIRAITGIKDEHLQEAKDSSVAFAHWQLCLKSLPPKTPVVIHYAQFERSFLRNWYAQQGEEFRLELICSHRIAKKLFPEIPSQNLRGLAGFFGGQLGELKRSASHVEATMTIWRAIAEKLEAIGIADFEELQAWTKEKAKTKSSRYQYRLDRDVRLSLPDEPGVYRMLAKDGRILYVGKATSLRSRVNSYFRGQKGRDRRKLEMLAQVWDMNVTECETPLEAALLETDEIKKWDPPYNVSLKSGDRRLLFYSRGFDHVSESQNAEYCLGPFRPMNILESLRDLKIWRETSEVRLIFYQEIEEQILNSGFDLFCQKMSFDPSETAMWSMRKWLSLGFMNLRRLLRQHEEQDIENVLGEQKDAEEPHQAVSGKFERLLIRSALAVRRAKMLTRLRNADVYVPTEKGMRKLSFRIAASPLPWAGADIADYDRMSVLLSEITKYSCIVEYQKVPTVFCSILKPRDEFA